MSNESDYHQSHVGWKVSPVCIKPGENNSRLMGLASYKVIETGTGAATLANKGSASNTLFIGGRGNDLYRVKELLANCAVIETPPAQEGFVVMKGRGQRRIIYLKELNTFVKHEHFIIEVSQISFNQKIG